MLYARGLNKIPSSSALTLSLAEPTTAAILGVFIVGENLSTMSWIGEIEQVETLKTSENQYVDEKKELEKLLNKYAKTPNNISRTGTPSLSLFFE